MRTLCERFHDQGYAVIASGLPSEVLGELRGELGRLAGPAGRNGYSARGALGRSAAVRRAAEELAPIAGALLDAPARPTKATFFDKTPGANWVLPWHQDRTIEVSSRAPRDGYRHWRRRDGLWHVEPPREVLERIVALRLHLDPCPERNGALRVVPGSHREGILDEAAVARVVAAARAVTVPAEEGEVLALAPLLLHSSGRSEDPAHRRVLHIEYSDLELPAPLAWGSGAG